MSLKYNLKNLPTNTNVYFNPNSSNNLDEIKEIIEGDVYFTLPNEIDINDNYKILSKYICRIIENSGFLCKGVKSRIYKIRF